MCVFFQVSRAEEKAKRKDRSRSKSPFRSFRWKKSSPKASGTQSDDEVSFAAKGRLILHFKKFEAS